MSSVQKLDSPPKPTREKAREEERKASEREKAREEGAGAAGTTDVSISSLDQLEENRMVGKAERDLLNFILTNGTTPMNFESDSEFYQGEDPEARQTVFDFISASMEGSSFSNSIYWKIYEEYSGKYYDGDSQEDMVKSLMDNPDRTVAYVTSQLCTPRYELSVKNFTDSLMSNDSWLVKYVPRAILVYQEKRLEDRISGLNRELAAASAEDQTAIMKRIMTLQRAKKAVKVKLGREKE